MAYIRDNTSVDPCLDLKQINEAIPCSPYLSHGALVEFLTLSWVLKDGTFHLCLSYLASSLKSTRENMILWFLNIRHSGTLFCMWFLTSAQQLFLLILPSID
jgi:hypothetical protein